VKVAEFNEPDIIINGVRLLPAAAGTIRVAVQNLATDLNANGLGEDEVEKSIARGYLENIQFINEVMERKA